MARETLEALVCGILGGAAVLVLMKLMEAMP